MVFQSSQPHSSKCQFEIGVSAPEFEPFAKITQVEPENEKIETEIGKTVTANEKVETKISKTETENRNNHTITTETENKKEKQIPTSSQLKQQTKD